LRDFSQAGIIAAAVTGRRSFLQDPDDRAPGALKGYAQYGGHGLTLALSTALFAWLGKLLDERLHMGPLFVILGTFVGFGAGFWHMYRQLVVEPGRREKDRERSSGDGHD
jgi:F0F1-type ATP synthase assembly protein I